MLQTGTGSPRDADTSLATVALSKPTTNTGLDPAATMEIPPLREMSTSVHNEGNVSAGGGDSSGMAHLVRVGVSAFAAGIGMAGAFYAYFGL